MVSNNMVILISLLYDGNHKSNESWSADILHNVNDSVALYLERINLIYRLLEDSKSGQTQLPIKECIRLTNLVKV